MCVCVCVCVCVWCLVPNLVTVRSGKEGPDPQDRPPFWGRMSILRKVKSHHVPNKPCPMSPLRCSMAILQNFPMCLIFMGHETGGWGGWGRGVLHLV